MLLLQLPGQGIDPALYRDDGGGALFHVTAQLLELRLLIHQFSLDLADHPNAGAAGGFRADKLMAILKGEHLGFLALQPSIGAIDLLFDKGQLLQCHLMPQLVDKALGLLEHHAHHLLAIFGIKRL
ncbi:hypothetical protein D3C87_1571940 [compost metagenome]